MVIREYHASDWLMLWPILKKEFSHGETYPYARTITELHAMQVWITDPQYTYVAESVSHDKKSHPRHTHELLGTYYITPNKPSAGSHVCNCGYIVATEHRNAGIGTSLYNDSVVRAKQLGFRAMQFNLVVSSNERSIYLWKKLGMHTVGKLPGAFKSPRHGFIDAFVMYRNFENET